MNKSLSILYRIFFARFNPIENGYYKLCHRRISRQLNAEGKKAYSSIRLTSCENLSYIREEERKSIISFADKTLSNTFNLLGSGDIKMRPVLWSTDFIVGYEWKPGTFYKQYRQVDLQKRVDVKVPRELSRFHFLLHLALAYRFTKDIKYTDKAKELIENWIETNPLMYSINWGCAMDVGIRAVNWIWSLSLFGDSVFDKKFNEKVRGSLYQHGWFIYRNLEGHCLRSNNTNHYYSDLVGLIHIASLFKGDKQADKWYNYSLKEFFRETRIQVLPSGFDYEGSTNYHRLVLELCTTTLTLLDRIGEDVPPDITARCELMFNVIYKLLMPNGTMPIVGDQDNGRCLPCGTEALNDYRYLMSLGAMLFSRGDFKEIGDGYNVYCAIFGDDEGFTKYNSIKSVSDERLSVLMRDAGFAIMRNKNDYLLFNVDNQGLYRDAHTFSSHTHSDWFSFVLCVNGIPFIIDPGTHVYSSDPESRNMFRSTRMHNTVEVDGQNQSRVFEDKLWSLERKGKVDILTWQSNPEQDVVSCKHNGYESVVHQRTIHYYKTMSKWVITDLMEGSGSHRYDVHFHLNEAVLVGEFKNGYLLKKDGIGLKMIFECSSQFEIMQSDTYISRGYGDKVKGKEIIVSLFGVCPAKIETTIIKENQ